MLGYSFHRAKGMLDSNNLRSYQKENLRREKK